MQKPSSILILLSLFIFASIFATGDVFAKKKLPSGNNTKKVTTTTKKSSTATKGVTVSVKLNPDRRGIVATSSNLEIASSVSYSLTYTSRGVKEGVGGSLTELSGIQTRELLFGTCSAGVCRYHPSPKNAKFVVTTTLKDGKKVSKVFRIKV